MNQRLRLVLLAAGGFAALAAVGLWLRAEDWPKHKRLIGEGVPAQALITAKGVGAPDNVHYTYSVDGRLYSGVGKAGWGTPPFDSLDVDDEVLIFHSKSDPELSDLGDPREHIRGQNRLLAIMLLLAAPAMIWAIMRELRTH